MSWGFDVDDVLTGARPDQGEPDALLAYASRLSSGQTGATVFADRVAAGANELATSSAKSVEKLSSVAHSVVVAQARELSRDVTKIVNAVRGYAQKLAHIRDSATRVRATVEAQLAVISRSRSTITRLSGPLGAPALFGWANPPGVLQPLPPALDPLDAQEYRRAVTRWSNAAAVLRTKQSEYRGLQADRQAANHALSSALAGTAAGQRVQIYGSAASTATTAISSIDASEKTVDALFALLSGAANAQAVADYCSRLTPEQLNALARRYPGQIGNMDGVPFAVRISANDQSIRAEIESIDSRIAALEKRIAGLKGRQRSAIPGLRTKIRDLTDEREYYQSLVDGDGAVVFDRANDRIVEVVGKLTSQTTEVITYVPGTGTEWSSFVDGGVQQVSKYLVNRDRSGQTVAFVYKDGPWVDWFGWESKGVTNYNSSGLSRMGQQLADFQTSIVRDSGTAGADLDVMGHSAGMSVVSASEVAGARYSSVQSLAGSYLLKGWEPHEGTAYNHYQYGIDAINYIDWAKSTPHESAAFTQHLYAPDTFEILGVTFQNELDNHGHIAEGPETNVVALDEMHRDIGESGKH